MIALLLNLLRMLRDTLLMPAILWAARRTAQVWNRFADPVIALAPDDAIYYDITLASYHPDARPAQLPGGWQLADTPGDATKACIYVQESTRSVAIGYRGTNLTDTHDLASDVQIILGLSAMDARVAESLAIYDRVRALWPDYHISVCGHSLGGTVCYIVAKHRMPQRCVVFNPGAGFNALFVQMVVETTFRAPWTRTVYTYKVLGDVISSFAVVGRVKLFRMPTADPLALHAISSFAPQPTAAAAAGDIAANSEPA